jgi:hypothetical protein
MIMRVEYLLKPLILSIVLITVGASSALAQEPVTPNAGTGPLRAL